MYPGGVYRQVYQAQVVHPVHTPGTPAVCPSVLWVLSVTSVSGKKALSKTSLS